MSNSNNTWEPAMGTSHIDMRIDSGTQIKLEGVIVQ